MPRKPAVPPEQIFEIIKQFDVFDFAKGKIKESVNPIWAEICKKLANRISPISLYLYVLQDRHDILTNLKKFLGLHEHIQNYTCTKFKQYDEKSTTNETSDSIAEDSTTDENNTTDSENAIFKKCLQKGLNKINFSISFSKEKWMKIKPQEKMRKDGVFYYHLQSGWTDAFVEKIWNECKLPCTYCFSEEKIYKEIQRSYIKIRGYCKECKNQLVGRCLKYPVDDNDDVIFYICTLDTRGIIHKSKRRLAGSERKRIKEQLQCQNAVQWRRENAKEIMNYGDEEPAHLYNLNVLRKARQEAKDNKLGLKSSINLFDSILNLKNDVEFHMSIRDIGFDKFHVFFWSPEQIDLFKDVMKLKMPLSIDATGSIVKKIIRLYNNGKQKSGHIFLYVAVTHIETQIIPVCQMLSEKHDTNFILYWLNYWLNSIGEEYRPLEVTTDRSLALQNACCLAFNNMTYKKYLENCFKLLKNETSDVPNCYIRIDIAHLIRSVSQWKCWKGQHKRIKDFYMRCIGLLSKIQNFSDFNNMLLSILIVCQTNYDESHSQCAESRKWLINKIQKHEFNDFQQYDKSFKNTVQTENENLLYVQIENLVRHIEEIRNQVSIKQDDTNPNFDLTPNPYYFPDITKNLIDLSVQFPAWTNVMRHIFPSSSDIATSARSETYFGDIKQNVLEKQKPIRADKFLIKYMRTLTGIMRLSKAVYNQQKDKTTNCIKKTVNKENILNFKENWRNLISTSEVFNEEDDNKEKLIIDDFLVNNEMRPINEVIPPIQSITNIIEKNVNKIITICRKKLISFFF